MDWQTDFYSLQNSAKCSRWIRSFKSSSNADFLYHGLYVSWEEIMTVQDLSLPFKKMNKGFNKDPT